ncbi:hypothetical protein QA596_10690 [Balneolales bacterium ANBcel1]|nr:hypothetical protein [Balneolales bacterium ANBcel1]
MNKLISTTVVFLLFSIALVPAGVSGGQHADPDAVSIVERMQQHYEQSIEGVDNYVMVMQDHTMYYQKAHDADGRPYFRSRLEADRMDGIYSAGEVSDFSLLSPEVFQSLKEQARYGGEEEHNGNIVHVLLMDELEGLIEEEEVSGALRDVRIYVDASNWVTRQLTFRADVAVEGGPAREVESVTTFSDYRNIEGMMIPFETVIVITGFSDMISDEQRKQAEEAMQQFESELENMPAQQREMVEQMMGDQIERYREMLADDRMEIIQKVEEVKVNTGMDDF